MKPIINLADAPAQEQAHGDHFANRMTQLAGPIGGTAIGANVTRVPPGKAAFPFHHHYANEEHFFILGGTGTLRLGTASHPVKANDYIVNLPGGPETAHQLINTGTEDLVYLAISTKITPEVGGYPDSAKSGVMLAPRGSPPPPFMVMLADQKDPTHYWDGEDGHTVAATVATATGAS